MAHRIGLGYDIHRLIPKESGSIVLGGHQIPCQCALVAHSDGDALLHALVDALLGALALGDIGEFFPDTDPAHKGRDSRDFVRKTLALPAFATWKIANLDCNIITQVPRLGPHKPAIRQSLAELLNLNLDCIGVKARTNERCDAIGQGQALAVQVIVLLEG